jgi:mannose/fructose/sorbose-specific phosphotransferase system IIA component
MFGIIVTGHGNFASGITSSLELIIGKQEQYIAVDFPQTDTKTELEQKIRQAIENFKDEEHILIFCDLLSGSPFNVSIMEAMNDDRIRVIYGVNLGMLIEALMERMQGESFEKVLADAIEGGKSQIGVFDSSNVEDDDDF